MNLRDMGCFSIMVMEYLLIQRFCDTLIRFIEVIKLNYSKKSKDNLPKNRIFINCQNHS